MAESNEAGMGRLAEVADLVDAIEQQLASGKGKASSTGGALEGRHVLITSGPTHEPIDPVRYIANRSSGKQGHAIAAAAAQAGARVTLVSGPVALPDPKGVAVLHVETAAQMLDAVRESLPADVAIFTAAVADWRAAASSPSKIKKGRAKTPPSLELVENEDILRTVASARRKRPGLVIGFAAETDDVVNYARKKRKDKGADWIVANDVSPSTGIMGGDRNRVHLLTGSGMEEWPEMSKEAVAQRLIERAAGHINREQVKP